MNRIAREQSGISIDRLQVKNPNRKEDNIHMVTDEEYLERLRRQRNNVYMDLECFQKVFFEFRFGFCRRAQLQ